MKFPFCIQIHSFSLFMLIRKMCIKYGKGKKLFFINNLEAYVCIFLCPILTDIWHQYWLSYTKFSLLSVAVSSWYLVREVQH